MADAEQEREPQLRRGTKWQSDKSINVANILTALLLTGSMIAWVNAWMMKEDSRVTALEVQQVNSDKNQARIATDLKDSNRDIKEQLRLSNQDVKDALRTNQQDVKDSLVRIENGQQRGTKTKN